MANRYLLPVYRRVYGEEYDHRRIECRRNMQNMMYLLQEAWVPVGDYGFKMVGTCVYSDELNDDAEYEWKKENARRDLERRALGR